MSQNKKSFKGIRPSHLKVVGRDGYKTAHDFNGSLNIDVKTDLKSDQNSIAIVGIIGATVLAAFGIKAFSNGK